MRHVAVILWLALAGAAVSTSAHGRSQYAGYAAKKKHGKGWLLFSCVVVVFAGGTGYLYWKFRKESLNGTPAEFRDYIKALTMGAADKALSDDTTPAKEASANVVPVAAKAVPITTPAKAAAGVAHAPIHGIDIKAYARINAARNKAFAFDDAALTPILLPYNVTPAQFAEAETVWQERMTSEPDPVALKRLHDEFNAASQAA